MVVIAAGNEGVNLDRARNLVYAELSSSADDLGKNGFDAVYGNGGVNAFNAVQ